MKISLRKANAIQQSISAELGRLNVATVMTISEFSNHTDILEFALGEKLKYAQSLLLTKILYEIRAKVGKANSEKIDGVLTEINYLTKQVGLATQVASANPKETEQVIKAKIHKLSGATNERLYSSSFVANVFADSTINEAKKLIVETRRKITKLKDQLLELNIQTQIELDDESADFLRDLGII